ncbi:hypothetical protein, partial [Streptomyces sp. IMTB 1903]
RTFWCGAFLRSRAGSGAPLGILASVPLEDTMTAQQLEDGGPLIPQPAMTREALRDAVRRIDMANLAVLDKECNEAFDRAAETGAINPLRFFLIKWATHVAIHRWPARAAALHEAERIAGDPDATEEQFRAAMETSSRILAEAQREIGQ